MMPSARTRPHRVGIAQRRSRIPRDEDRFDSSVSPPSGSASRNREIKGRIAEGRRRRRSIAYGSAVLPMIRCAPQDAGPRIQEDGLIATHQEAIAALDLVTHGP